MTRPNPFSIYPHTAPSSPSGKPKPKPAAQGTTEPGKLLREIQAANKAERREVMTALQRQGSPGAMGVYAAEELLRWIEENIPCLNYRQRVDLVSGHATRSLTTIEALEIGDTLMAWWCRSEDPDEIGMKLELLLAQGGLPRGSGDLLNKVRARVNDWRVDQRLPRLREITRSWDQVKAWAEANGVELDLEQAAAVVAERTNALAGLHQELHADEPLVFGRVEPAEARLWLLCCDWVKDGNTQLDPKKTPLLKLERKAAEQMDICLRLQVNHPDQIKAERERRMGVWNGSPNVIVQDSRGRWFYGDGTPAIPQPGGGFKRQRSGLGGLFDDVDREAIWSETTRCFQQQLEQMKRLESTTDSKVDQA